MNLLILDEGDLIAPGLARVTGRRLEHAREVLRVQGGASLRVGLIGGAMGRAAIRSLTDEAMELSLELDEAPPPKLPLTLLLALPRPKVLNRCLASAASLGVARIVLLNAWKVEKAYWNSPRMAPESLRHQLLLGLEQARDTVLPELRVARLFRPFMEVDFPSMAEGSLLLGQPGAAAACPRGLAGPAVVAVGPEGGWIPAELESFDRAGFTAVELGPRILRTETALAALVGRLY